MMQLFLIKNILWLTMAGVVGITGLVLGAKRLWLQEKHVGSSTDARVCYDECVQEAVTQHDFDICYKGLEDGTIKECE